MGQRKRQAQVTAGKQHNVHLDRVKQAENQLADVEATVRDDDEIRIDLPLTSVPARRTVVMLEDMRPCFGPPATLHVWGPERIALVGANGTGKTTLLRTITGQTTWPASPPKASANTIRSGWRGCCCRPSRRPNC